MPITVLIRVLRVLCVGWLLFAVLLAEWEVDERWVEPGRNGTSFVQLWAWWGRWALLPALLVLVVGLVGRAKGRWWRAIAVFGLVVAAWGVLIEPAMLVVREERIEVADAPQLRIALVSDLHIGLFGRDLPGLVARLNSLDVDAVVVAGDWTYDPWRDLDEVFAPLADLRHPVFGVLGNHDLASPGSGLSEPLRAALTRHGVTLLEGRSQRFKGWELMGLDDLWGGHARSQVPSLLAPRTMPRLVVMHQPATVLLLPDASADVLVAGHTHGGQVMVPWLTERLVLPVVSAGGYADGRYDTAAGVLRVTSGVGMIGLPARIGVPPEIVVLELG